MKIELPTKTAVVTGPAAGIGFAIAQGLAAAGATVVINGRTQAAFDKARARLEHAQPAALVRGVAADLGTASGCEVLVKAEPSADILVNNLGIYGPQDFFDIPDRCRRPRPRVRRSGWMAVSSTPSPDVPRPRQSSARRGVVPFTFARWYYPHPRRTPP